MKMIGKWMADLNDTQLPLPQELVSAASPSVQAAVCQYLAKGIVFETCRGHSWCRFCCGIDRQQMGNQELTDGEWIWPDGLVHYVRGHGVVLPDEFIASATSGRVPAWSGDDKSESIDFWIAWAGKRRSPIIRQRLAEALASARAAEPDLISSLLEAGIQKILQSEAEGTDHCTFAGCSRRALVGRRICARHILDDQLIRDEASRLYSLPKDILTLKP